MKLSKFLELVVAVLAVVGLLTLIFGSQAIASIVFALAAVAVIGLFFALSLGYMLLACIVFLFYGAYSYLF